MSADIQRSNGHSSATGHLFDPEQNSDLGSLATSGISAVIIGSEWHFKPAGVMEVEKRFAERLRQMRAVSMFPSIRFECFFDAVHHSYQACENFFCVSSSSYRRSYIWAFYLQNHRANAYSRASLRTNAAHSSSFQTPLSTKQIESITKRILGRLHSMAQPGSPFPALFGKTSRTPVTRVKSNHKRNNYRRGR